MTEYIFYFVLSGLALPLGVFVIINALIEKKNDSTNWLPMMVLGGICEFIFILFLVLGIVEVVK